MHDATAVAPALLADGVAIPSPEEFAAAGLATPPRALQHNQIVSKVLIDALQGGNGERATVDSLLSSLPTASDALAPLAWIGDVRDLGGWDVAILSPLQDQFAFDMLALNVDAAPLT